MIPKEKQTEQETIGQDRKKQWKTPLLDALENYYQENPAYFCIPGHRFERGISPNLLDLFGEQVFHYDLTEAEGLDDLHHPEGPILEAQQLASELYKTKRTWFLVNGTTCGNEAMILASVKPGEKILIPRNAHKSVQMGLILSGAVPVFLKPSWDEKSSIVCGIDPALVEQALTDDPAIRAVMLVSPTYYGIISDISAIADVCHRHAVPLLVDEAHGSHLYFSEKLPAGALSCGADLVSQSIHKTAGSMTQSSMLHMNSALIDEKRVDDALKLVMSTSPSYILMASLDAARYELAVNGISSMERALHLSGELKEELAHIDGIRVREFSTQTVRKELHVYAQDPLRVVFSASECGLSGFELKEKLYEIGKISLELADPENVVAVVTGANTTEDIRRLADAVRFLLEQETSAGCSGRSDVNPVKNNFCDFPLPEMALSPRDAWYATTEMVLVSKAAGRVAGEAIIPYPPGIPLVYPGEIITREIQEKIYDCRDNRISVHGMADENLKWLKVLSDR